jgi:hypothetical protein
VVSSNGPPRARPDLRRGCGAGIDFETPQSIGLG